MRFGGAKPETAKAAWALTKARRRKIAKLQHTPGAAGFNLYKNFSLAVRVGCLFSPTDAVTLQFSAGG